MELILASQSPRRRELLKRIVNEDFQVSPAEIDESMVGYSDPKQYVLAMAHAKAAKVAEQNPAAIVIGCDTIVTINNEILGKPLDREDASGILHLLSGQTHIVYTAVVIQQGIKLAEAVVPCEVTFWDLTDQEIDNYLLTDEYADKAGAYGIQDQGALLVKSVCGDYYSVVGFPVATVARMLKDFEQPRILKAQ